jgi:hypothetical protein
MSTVGPALGTKYIQFVYEHDSTPAVFTGCLFSGIPKKLPDSFGSTPAYISINSAPDAAIKTELV